MGDEYAGAFQARGILRLERGSIIIERVDLQQRLEA
jgi:hypothetical protein